MNLCWWGLVAASPAILVGAAFGAGQGPPVSVIGKDGGAMVLVPAGSFIMGTGEGRPEEGPSRRVDLPGFYIDKTEVTVGQYSRFLQETGSRPPTGWAEQRPPRVGERLPVTNITWYDAMGYALWAGKRLPTEAEWEKAARGIDGRRFPWGQIDEVTRRNLAEDKDVAEVGAHPAGASPCGCLDMAGNAWEWTADWFEVYPGSAARSIHFGRQYKIIRGGGATYFYGQPNTGRCAQRARLVPYGAHDALGFRCVMDAEPEHRAYDPKAVLKEAEDGLQASLREPARLSYEREYEALLKTGRVPITIVGERGQRGHVRAGFPLPEGRIQDGASLRLVKADGAVVPMTARALSKWEDGSVRWALLDFAGEAGQPLQVEVSGEGPVASPLAPGLRFQQTGDVVTIDTGRIVARLTPADLVQRVTIREHGSGDGSPVLGRMSIEAQVDAEGVPLSLRALAAERIEVEESGEQHATVRLSGWLGDVNGRKSALGYELRVLAAAGCGRLGLLLTVTHLAPRRQPFDEPAPVIRVADLAVRFVPGGAPARVLVGTEQEALVLPAAERTEVLQADDLSYAVRQPGGKDYQGRRHPGWLAVELDEGWCTLGLRHFWQNCPKSLLVTAGAVGVRLWAGDKPFEWEAGLAKTHELVIECAATPPAQVVLDPLRITMPPAWMCGTEAAGGILPRTREVIALLPYWECWRDSAMRAWLNAMPFGMRDFGDAYMGGPYKGKNAYADLEYDVHLNFMFQYLRTGETWYVDAAEPMARHQADIDVNHHSGHPWKHSPQHTTTEADLGHVFVRGMLLHHLLTGERRSLEVAMRVGDWIAGNLERGQGTGNERQIGWSLYALTGLYEVTREPRYLRAAEALCHRLIAGQSPTGKFAIRWDNRIAFFNGIAMNGMLSVQELNGDPQLAEGILKVAGRTLGFYPEYACRTLNAYCWAAGRTRDPRFIDAVERTWRSSLEFLMERSAEAEETHAWRFPRFAARYNLLPLFDAVPGSLPEPTTWKATRFRSAEVEVGLRPAGQSPAPVMVIREGLAEGKAELIDGAGRRVRVFELRDAARFFEAAVFTLSGQDTYRLRLTGAGVRGWQIQRDASGRMTVHDPGCVQLPFLFPRAYGYLTEGVGQVKVRFEAVGEGFHGVTLYDPAGKPVAAVRHFIDFQDPGRYELELKAPVGGEVAGWSLQIDEARVLSIEGFSPYWASDPAELFHPR
ncbi:MAG TPA: SUMF1/EgtB/PvdO family nonheme iron enzyme [Phycisphaerae bacterium]|nr:SUMF1/EgtB/PvdO family nonheme iron enzyme [Phycisphaerae bacterium]HRY67617.1 SUMF1/EgtB/PvdO family nonheme iron enzyme [Phycisphaerae bacterium]HSA25004.1 SUMF1/EgtB/PvdO family nonheme iron enzyme [Phycisphaerae bacterium]